MKLYVRSEGRRVWLKADTVLSAIDEVQGNDAGFPEQTLDIFALAGPYGDLVAGMVDLER